MTHYKAIIIPSSKWTEATITSAPAVSAIQCGLRCSKQKKEDKVCHQFKFEDGVCEMSGAWICGTTETSSMTVFREIIGQFGTTDINWKGLWTFFVTETCGRGDCSCVEIVAASVGNTIIRGTYTYLQDSSDRPVFRHNTDPGLCLFWFNTWKVDMCTFLTTDPNPVGFIYSSSPKTQSPEDISLTWNYADGSPPDGIVVKC